MLGALIGFDVVFRFIYLRVASVDLFAFLAMSEELIQPE